MTVRMGLPEAAVEVSTFLQVGGSYPSDAALRTLMRCAHAGTKAAPDHPAVSAERWRVGGKNPYTVYRDHDGPRDAEHAAEHSLGYFRDAADAQRAVDAVNAEPEGVRVAAARWQDAHELSGALGVETGELHWHELIERVGQLAPPDTAAADDVVWALAPLQNAAEGMGDAAARLEDFEQVPAAQLLRAHAAAVRLHRCAPAEPDVAGELAMLRSWVIEQDQGLTPRPLNGADVVAEIERRIKAACPAVPTPPIAVGDTVSTAAELDRLPVGSLIENRPQGVRGIVREADGGRDVAWADAALRPAVGARVLDLGGGL